MNVSIIFEAVPCPMPGVSLYNATIDGQGIRVAYTEGSLDKVDLTCINNMLVMATPKVLQYLVAQIMQGKFPTTKGRVFNRLLFYAGIFHQMGAVAHALSCLRTAHKVSESASEQNLVRSLFQVYMKGPERTLEQKLLTPKQFAQILITASINMCGYVQEAEQAFA